jgi:hypothetical protein
VSLDTPRHTSRLSTYLRRYVWQTSTGSLQLSLPALVLVHGTQSEVCNLEITVIVQEHILRLDVAVCDTMRVNVFLRMGITFSALVSENPKR